MTNRFTKVMERSLGFSALLVALTTAPSYAAKKGVVTGDANVYQDRSSTSTVVDRVSSGTELMMSDLPTGGFYKVRTAGGKIGFVEESLVGAPGSAAAPGAKSRSARGRRDAVGGRKPGPRVRLFGGIAAFNASELGTLLAVGDISNGTYLGGDFRLNFSRKFAAVVRVEKIGKSFSAADAGGDTFEISLGSMPLMAGIDYTLTSSPNFSLSLAGMGGLAMGTKVTSVATSQAAPNTTEIAYSAKTFLVKFDANLHVSESFTIFGELGYRMLTTDPAVPAAAANGDYLFRPGTGQPFTPVALNLGGLIVGVGIGLSF